MLTIIDSWGVYVEALPCSSRSDCGKRLSRWCLIHRVGLRLRSDNARGFKEPNSPWRLVCHKKGIIAIHSAPFHTAMNRPVERTNRTIQDAVRATIVGCDLRVWDWCFIFCVMVWVRIPGKGKSDSIYKRCTGRDPSLRLVRRFG